MSTSVQVSSDNTEQVITGLAKAYAAGLEAVGGTAERYAKGLCPVDTGRLRNSITHAVDKTSVYIGTNVEYGPYVELGTSKRKGANGGRGYLRPAATEHTAEYKAIFESALRNA